MISVEMTLLITRGPVPTVAAGEVEDLPESIAGSQITLSTSDLDNLRELLTHCKRLKETAPELVVGDFDNPWAWIDHYLQHARRRDVRDMPDGTHGALS
jgi:hypothetical protein